MEAKASHSISSFAIKFCNELEKHKTTVCSPLSAESVLALLALGCKNDSRVELLKALDFPNDDSLRSSFGYLTSALKSIQGVTLNIANKVYLKKGGILKAGIKKDAEEVFKSSLEQLDFNEKEAAADAINKWVEQETNEKIKDIVSPDMFDNLTGLVLLNAIYFQGTWENPFEKIYTSNRPFHVNNTTQINVPQMYMEEEYFKYKKSADLKAQILQMDYKGGEASMVIVLPKEIEGLSEVMKKLAEGHDLMADIDTLRETDVNVMIPKFKVEMTIDLKQLLPKLGIKSIFDSATADIDMLTSSNGKLYVSEAIQKAFIAVDESGTEAAACTMMTIEQRRCGRYPKDFIADRPFLYLLIARNIPLFVGIYEGSEYVS